MSANADPSARRRRAAKLSLDVLDISVRDRVKRITRIACRVLGARIAAVALGDSTRESLKAERGESFPRTPAELAFWADAVGDAEVLVVPDTSEDERFSANPLVSGGPGIRFYAGVALQGQNGERAGTLFAIDRAPISPSEEDIRAFRDLGTVIENELILVSLARANVELTTEFDLTQRRTQIDAMTQLWNKAGILEALDRELERNAREGALTAVLVADVDFFKKVNDTHGHLAGDAVLRTVAQRLRESVRPYDSIGRYGGEEFIVVSSVPSMEAAQVVAERIRNKVKDGSIGHEGKAIDVTISIGVALSPPGERVATTELIERADAALYKAKRDGRDRVVVEAPRGAAPRLWNRKAIFESLGTEAARAMKSEGQLAVVIGEVDRLKGIGDIHGRGATEAVQREVLRRIRQAIQPLDIVGRLELADFVVVLGPETAGGAMKIAERIRQAIGGSPIEHEGAKIEATISLGVACVLVENDGAPDRVVELAESALYQAKSKGPGSIEFV